MDKPLSEMTNEELWELFPIIIVEHDNTWKDKYYAEKNLIVKSVGEENIIRINHIGSTAIPNIVAKPTIDILLEIKNGMDTDNLIRQMESLGYIYSCQPEKPAPHMMFMKGYTPEGFKGQAFHVHIRYKGDWDELNFRDYLIAHPDIAKEYGELKLKLKDEYEYNRDAYTEAKTGFIKKVNALAAK